MKRPLMAACLAVTAGILLHMADAYIAYIACIMAAAIITVIGSNKIKHQDKKLILVLFLCAVGGYVWTGISAEPVSGEVEDMELCIKNIREFEDGYTFIGESQGVKYLINYASKHGKYFEESAEESTGVQESRNYLVNDDTQGRGNYSDKNDVQGAGEYPDKNGVQEAGEYPDTHNIHEAEDYTVRRDEFREGDYILVTGVSTPIKKASNPGGFDKKKYYASKGIAMSIKAKALRKSDRKSKLLPVILYTVRKYLKSSIEYIFPEKYAGILSAMLLGERDSMDQETKELYRENGIAHILAISALHVALIASFFMKMLEVSGMRKKKRAYIAIVFVVFYAFMTGLSPSTVRATVMLILTYLAMIKGRTSDPFTSIALTLVLSVFTDVTSITDNGLVLSFAAGSAVIVGGYVCERLSPSVEKYIETKMNGKILPGGERRKINKVKEMTVRAFDTIVVSVTINIFMLPIIIYYYYEITPYALLLNFIIIPLLSLAVAAGAVGMMFGAAALGISLVSSSDLTVFLKALRLCGSLLSYPARIVLDLYEWLCMATLKLPFSRIITGGCDLKWMIVYYIIVGSIYYLWLRKRPCGDGESQGITAWDMLVWGRTEQDEIDGGESRRKNIMPSVLIVLLVVLFIGTVKMDNYLTDRVVFLDVGQGDSSIIHTRDGLNIISDCGTSSGIDVGKTVLVPALKYYGVGRISHIFISHFDNDHVSGIFYMLNNYELTGIKIDEIVVAEGTEDEKLDELRKLASLHSIKVVYAKAGDKLVKGNGRVDIIHPFVSEEVSEHTGNGDSENGYSGNEHMGNEHMGNERTGNEYSLCFRFQYKDFSVLYTGDIGSEEERTILEKCRCDLEEVKNSENDRNSGDASKFIKLDSTVLKVAHHGSKYSSCKEFTEAAAPEYAVISVGQNNLYGHPAPETLERLNDEGCIIYRTDSGGAVIFRMKGE